MTKGYTLTATPSATSTTTDAEVAVSYYVETDATAPIYVEELS